MTVRAPHHQTAKPPSEYWRSLNELAADPRLVEALEQEFAGYDPGAVTGLTRRSFVKLMSASMALAGLTLTGCRRWPQQEIAPYANRQRDPNTRQQYATMLSRGGIAHALLVTTFDGRPIKVEGNPDHPIAQGATDALAQASILELYDPQRTRGVTRDGARASWSDFARFLEAQVTGTGAGVAVLAEADGSPALARLRAQLADQRRDLKWYTWEPLHRDGEAAGTRAAFGRTLRPQYHLDKADIIVTLDADILGRHPAMVQHARDWAAGRRSADAGRMNRLYAIESGLSTTGSVADHRKPERPSRLAAIAQQILDGNPSDPFIARLLADLAAHRGRAVVIAGPQLPPAVHERVWRINRDIGAIGPTVSLIAEPDYDRDLTTQIGELAGTMHSGQVKTLLILGGNPVYDAPADVRFAEALERVEHTAHLTRYPNETTAHCAWALPRAHDFEAWGDGRSWDGTHCLRQPLVYPLFDGRSDLQATAMLLGDAEPDGENLVRAAVTDDDAVWRASVQLGFVKDSAAGPADDAALRDRPIQLPTASAAVDTFDLLFVADAGVYDGRHAENGWLQETPDPLTKLTWDNAALMNIKDAHDRGIRNGDVIEIEQGDRKIRIAAYLMPGQARGTMTLPLGYGRGAAGPIGTAVGFNVYGLRTTHTQHSTVGATVTKTGQRYRLASTSDHHLIDGIGMKLTRQRVGEKGRSGVIVKEATLAEYQHNPGFVRAGAHGDVRLQMYPMPQSFNDPHAWGMTIDLSACTGCAACVVACQSENNIPIVGKDQVLMSRQMQWLRIDRYFKTTADDEHAEQPQVVHMPMMCQHCENAPCEQVCPVAATTHDAEGLNVMVYNRCIGTRYCSNNCPYKVRRFNYFDFHAKDPRGAAKPWLGMPDSQQRQSIDKVRQMGFNPDVTVRMRGVMEKCTYCVQRIAQAKTAHRVAQVRQGDHEQRTLPDGAVITACQQACPTQAITFGNLNDPHSRVAQIQQTVPRGYDVLDELNTRPRTKYLAVIRNPKR